MPFGLTNGPSTFQAVMNDLLHHIFENLFSCFFDDILIYGKILTEHLTHLRLILALLREQNFFAELSKCVFGVHSVDYLGHILSGDVVKPDPEKIRAIVEWPTPKSITTLKGFFGLTGFYRWFIKQYVSHAAPLTDLLKIGSFTWSTSTQQAFENLKHIMTNAPVLDLPNFTMTFDVETDAFGVAITAVLS
ncbi:PREDICTED: uncharacterized protein LOC109363613 [Lupinus angustifolius]|uniref:uncharacterized protein LOC109363613 n=1 Tax=Lupinus angustifolius TaxID=3871 RepID=UPI00092F063D|nr:PREDICTED: uncharacterized protein LOC109363613 [Lupinus angustifolius]